ncbi:Ribosomal large subunit pseudouridine synthase D [Spiroplasma sp. JKS002669]|uniref:RluA family pseudouridine synthase n=1 Tax=Spiroplasma attinicola TaxID=2904537 RepID=UPI0020BD6CF7|nr:RluA family pseudouridine synthase [Spiroplasma sp. JKS002669]MCL6429120.1 Ribosomal large subunit pseudouridine synthase D [Spiroplasma sp. JKS002669]
MKQHEKQFSFQYQDLSETRLDKFLAQQLQDQNYSRTFITNLIKQGQVTVNDKVAASQKQLLKTGDMVVINIINNSNENGLVAKPVAINIIYEDDDIIVINKANNLVVHPGAGNFDNTLVNGLLFNMKELSSVNQESRPGIVHRLDKQTTGLLIVAKNNQSHYFLAQELKNHEIIREYIALVHGKIKAQSGTIDAPIARDKVHRRKMAVNEANAKAAITHFKVLETFNNYSLVSCQLETGRTHQIRVHFQWINHPVVNDPTYSKFPVEDSNLGQYLHAYKITFKHPRTKKVMVFTAELPDFFQNRLKLLRKENGN